MGQKSENIRILVAILLFATSLAVSFVAVKLLGTLILIGTGVILTWLVLSFITRAITREVGVSTIELLALLSTRPLVLIGIVLVSIVISAVVVIYLADLIKLIAVLGITWVLFRFLLRNYAPDISREIDEYVYSE